MVYSTCEKDQLLSLIVVAALERSHFVPHFLLVSTILIFLVIFNPYIGKSGRPVGQANVISKALIVIGITFGRISQKHL